MPRENKILIVEFIALMATVLSCANPPLVSLVLLWAFWQTRL
jgi:hypothetical protein